MGTQVRAAKTQAQDFQQPKQPKSYSDKIRFCYDAVSERNGGRGASPADVCKEMCEREWLSPLDTTIDIADLMREIGYVQGGGQ